MRGRVPIAATAAARQKLSWRRERQHWRTGSRNRRLLRGHFVHVGATLRHSGMAGDNHQVGERQKALHSGPLARRPKQ
jgi:hypothetical protein